MSEGMARGIAWAFAALCLLAPAAGCGSDSPSEESAATQTTESATAPGAGLPESVREKGVLEIASDMPFPPYEYESGGKVIGFEVELADAMAKRLGVRAQFVQLPFDGIIPALQARKYPIAMSAISDTKERERVVDFVNYAVDNEAILVPEGNPKSIADASSLCGLTLAVVRGTIGLRNAEIYSKRCVGEGRPPITISTFQGDGVAQLTVRSGKADAATSSRAALAHVAKTVDGGKTLDVVNYEDPANPLVPVGLAMPRGQEEFRAALVAALEQVFASGEYERILAKYGLEALAAEGVTVNSPVN